MSAPSATPKSTSRKAACLVSGHSASFPKSRRLLRPAEFRAVYDRGFKIPCSCFVAFCLKTTDPPESLEGPRVGFTTPKALGKAVLRNRMRRRLRETVRTRLSSLDPSWRIVWNLRRAALEAPHVRLISEVEKVLTRCSA